MSMLLGYGGAYRKSKGKKVLTPSEYQPKTPSAKQSDIAVHFQLASSEPTGPAQPPAQLRKPGKTEIIAIGISTGGPDALRVVFAKLDADLQVPIVVVQHMPPGFTNEFAKSLDRICPLEVKEAEDGDPIQPGRILIAQGNKHLEVERKASGFFARLSDTPLVSGHRPSADVLFASVAMAYSNHALGVIMTGMGRDGAQHLGTIYKEGGMTLGQDEASAVVYGMPRVAYELGHVMEQVSLNNMAKRICEVAKTPR
jgi:two-component system chemotaxis response regulator CheB